MNIFIAAVAGGAFGALFAVMLSAHDPLQNRTIVVTVTPDRHVASMVLLDGQLSLSDAQQKISAIPYGAPDQQVFAVWPVYGAFGKFEMR